MKTLVFKTDMANLSHYHQRPECLTKDEDVPLKKEPNDRNSVELKTANKALRVN